MARRPRRIAILGHTQRPQVRRAAARLLRLLVRRGHDVRLDERLATEMKLRGEPLDALARRSEILVALGGDGTTLAGARALAGRHGALLPINHGGLGFLSAAEADEAEAAIDAALAGKWPVERRSMVEARTLRRGRPIARGVAMNDVVVKGAGGYAAVHLRIHARGENLGRVVADGVIVASAAGSTGYSLSAGGPLLAPDVEALVVSPVCAHSLGSRSLVLSPGTVVSIRVLGSMDRPLLLLDGQDRHELEARDEIHARLRPSAVRVFRNPERPFARALQAKLGWQGSPRRSF
jgi:NAD+ kinase